MATIVTRSGKGTPLTHSEVDANFTNLNTDKLEAAAIANMVETTDIGVSVQAYSANLDEYAAVNPTTAGLALLDDADVTAQQTTLGLVIGTNVQAYDVDTAKLDVAQSWTAKQTFATTIKAQQALEKITITAGAPAATQHFDWLTQAIQYFTSNGANNWTLNVRGDGSTTLNSLLAVGESATISVWTTMGATPYYENAMTIDGNSVTPKWLGGISPSAGDASCINIYTYTIIKTADATFIVLASKTRTT